MPKRFTLSFGATLAFALLSSMFTFQSSPASATSNTFSVRCDHVPPSQSWDPIVHPGQEGHHLHDFIGNESIAIDSTHEDLRAGETNCDNDADKSAYWVPALYKGAPRGEGGEKVDPSGVTVYYRGATKDAGEFEAHPADSSVIARITDEHASEGGGNNTRWACASGVDLNAYDGCVGGTALHLHLEFPDCWNGTDLGHDPDHMSHMAYSTRVQGEGRECPSSHPHSLPLIEMRVTYRGVDQPFFLAMPNSDPKTGTHGDFMNAWDQAELEKLVDSCQNAGLPSLCS